jgi:hypothetical protein
MTLFTRLFLVVEEPTRCTYPLRSYYLNNGILFYVGAPSLPAFYSRNGSVSATGGWRTISRQHDQPTELVQCVM